MVDVARRVVRVDPHSVTENVGGVLCDGNAYKVLMRALRAVQVAVRNSVLVDLILEARPLRGSHVEKLVVLVRELFPVGDHQRLVVGTVEPKRPVLV